MRKLLTLLVFAFLFFGCASKDTEAEIDIDKLKLFDIRNTTKALEEFYCSIVD